MKNVTNEYIPTIWEIDHNKVEISQTEMRERYESSMLEYAYHFGYCYIAALEKGKLVSNELPDYIMVKDREFKKNLENAYIKNKIPFVQYTATDGNIEGAQTFIWLKRSQIRSTTPIGIQIQDLELQDRITAVLFQLKGDYKTNTNQSYTNFLLNLEKEIEKLLTNSQLTWEQIFDLWKDQRIVRELIVDEYCEQYIP